ncbi:MAG: aminoacyl-tRNA hydrolase [Treponema sp.]|jgi:PTH1 family peptidyl-tRNA hydrolase|nr:aminoacyl-tRNA hydrolase [Treponema sp.]
MIKAVVFLGNPGAKYRDTRHNAGRLLSELYALAWEPKFKGLYAPYKTPETTIHFLQPETFMNLSGESVIALANFFKIDRASILIVHDEIELHLGAVSLKFSGGLGGHNGLRSIRAVLGSPDFWRLRLGVDRPPEGSSGAHDIADWVLNPFAADERPLLREALGIAKKCLDLCLTQEPDSLLPDYAKVNNLALKG